MTLFARMIRRAREEDGAIALMTIAFLTFLGFILIIYLWTIGQASGAYNTLQGAAQAGAYAAVGTTNTEDQENPLFYCDRTGTGGVSGGDNRSTDGFCGAGRTFDVARQAVGYTLKNTKANFGLSLDKGTVHFADPQTKSEVNGIYAYEVGWATATARQMTNNTCDEKASTQFKSGPGGEQRACWMLRRGANAAEPQHVSGVALALTSVVKICPKCPEFSIHADAAATQAQDETQPYN